MLEARVGIEPTHKGFADPFLSELSLSISMLDQGLELFCPLFVHLSKDEQTKTRVDQSFKPLWRREYATSQGIRTAENRDGGWFTSRKRSKRSA